MCNYNLIMVKIRNEKNGFIKPTLLIFYDMIHCCMLWLQRRYFQVLVAELNYN